ncbi:MAG: hypothetical protein Q8P80_01510 [Candidatus Levybacteria bacterium]|nr:hypothetical protein [Candidatus Levybacteria bacterium]
MSRKKEYLDLGGEISVEPSKTGLSKVFEIIDKVRKGHVNGEPYPKDPEEEHFGENPGKDVPVSMLIDKKDLEAKENFFKKHEKKLLILGAIAGVITVVVMKDEHFENLRPFKKRENPQKK